MRSKAAVRTDCPYSGIDLSRTAGWGSSVGEQNHMARPTKSFSELQRQFIGAELGRREAGTRKDSLAELQVELDDLATAPPPLKVVPAER